MDDVVKSFSLKLVDLIDAALPPLQTLSLSKGGGEPDERWPIRPEFIPPSEPFY